VWEIGWKVLPEYQRRGIATAAVRHMLPRIVAEQKYTELHAFPPIENAASNALCRTTGFRLLGPCDFEFPAGNWLHCNDWLIDPTGLRTSTCPAVSQAEPAAAGSGTGHHSRVAPVHFGETYWSGSARPGRYGSVGDSVRLVSEAWITASGERLA
jgi:hypothetical protein